MRRVFGDTFYFLALLNRSDRAHTRVDAFTAAFDGEITTTAWELTELADAMADPPNRERFIRFLDDVRNDDQVVIEPPDATVFDEGLTLYSSRNDKGWSLTDCISFAVMRREDISDTLTGDRHFEQAGFRALLL